MKNYATIAILAIVLAGCGGSSGEQYEDSMRLLSLEKENLESLLTQKDVTQEALDNENEKAVEQIMSVWRHTIPMISEENMHSLYMWIAGEIKDPSVIRGDSEAEQLMINICIDSAKPHVEKLQSDSGKYHRELERLEEQIEKQTSRVLSTEDSLAELRDVISEED